MTDNNGVNEDQKDPRSIEDKEDPNELLRGLSSESCRSDKEGNRDPGSEEQEAARSGMTPPSELDRELQLVKETLTSEDIAFVKESIVRPNTNETTALWHVLRVYQMSNSTQC